MTLRVQLEPAYVLHRRPYRNTSLILDLFSLHHGRVSVLARSARGLKSRYKGTLELFSPMLVSWSGRGELKLLGNVELSGAAHELEGDSLLCGFYLNELLVRFLHREDPYLHLFSLYRNTLDCLKSAADMSVSLRYFEKHLLRELGYGLPFQREASTGLSIDPKQFYQYDPERGFLQVGSGIEPHALFSGRSLLAFRDEVLSDEVDIRDIKRLMRQVLAKHLAGKPIKSRALFG